VTPGVSGTLAIGDDDDDDGVNGSSSGNGAGIDAFASSFARDDGDDGEVDNTLVDGGDGDDDGGVDGAGLVGGISGSMDDL